jgi:hypothetical protein
VFAKLVVLCNTCIANASCTTNTTQTRSIAAVSDRIVDTDMYIEHRGFVRVVQHTTSQTLIENATTTTVTAVLCPLHACKHSANAAAAKLPLDCCSCCIEYYSLHDDRSTVGSLLLDSLLIHRLHPGESWLMCCTNQTQCTSR